MTTFKYSLDRSSRKFPCPNCGKKKLVMYVENETQSYLDDSIGRCDRESKCGYHRTPKDNQPLVDISKIPIRKVEPSFHADDVIGKFGNNYQNNNFIKYLQTKFDPVDIKKAIKRYLLCTSNHWNGATIFWQINDEMNICAGKVMLYNASTGKRIKKPYPHINWMHNILKKSNLDDSCGQVLQCIPKGHTNVMRKSFNSSTISLDQNSEFILKQCLFGLHLLIDEPHKVIAIVEAEKTAVIMSIYLPCYVWMATGSKSGFKEEILKPLKGKDIIAFPDKSSYVDWQKICDSLNQKGYNIVCSQFSEVNCSSVGDDLIDYIL